LVDSYFQEDNITQVPWTPQVVATGLYYNFQVRDDGANTPQSGHQMGVIALLSSTTSNGVFGQPITVYSGKTYYFSGVSPHYHASIEPN
jgi:hypothetical protein